MGAALRASPKGLESPSNPKGTVVATGAGLRASAKVLEPPPDTKVTRAARFAVTPNVIGQKSAVAIVAVSPWTGEAGRAEHERSRRSLGSLATVAEPAQGRRVAA